MKYILIIEVDICGEFIIDDVILLPKMMSKNIENEIIERWKIDNSIDKDKKIKYHRHFLTEDYKNGI